MEKLLQQILNFLQNAYEKAFKPKNYQIVTYPVSTAGVVDTTGANAVIFINRGTQNAYVNNELITTDQSIANWGLNGEIDKTQYTVTFAGAGDPLVYCRVKIYDK